MSSPIKRHESLKPLSRDHHLGLLLCWKINRGFAKGVEPERIKKYADWFYFSHLLPHFKMEEQHVFPLMGNEQELIVKAMGDHRKLEELFTKSECIAETLHMIETELEQHIRFEERILFNAIQEIATKEQLQTLAAIHHEEKFCENEADPFWI